MQSSNNKRIAKNTILLYIRMIVVMLVSLYTSRVILSTLGIMDYGIYNVVGGFVAMFGFLNNAMSLATQRFLAYEIGQKNPLMLNKIFIMSINIHFIIAIIIFLVGETIGVWILNTYLTIPLDRIIAAKYVFHFAILSLIVNIISVPYNAIIIANEKMNIFAIIGIIDVILKLIIVFIIQESNYDKLKFYSFLFLCVSLFVNTLYRIYCRSKFKESKYFLFWDKNIFKTLTNYSFWTIWGSFAWVILEQGLNILLNIFFGPIINAARGIAFQVNSLVLNFVSNFRNAVNPQIIKYYSLGKSNEMYSLAIESSKYSYFLVLLIALPIFLEIESILNLWLNKYPEYTSIFCRLVILNTIIHTCDISIIFSALGKIRENQLYGSISYISILPISYLLYKIGYPPITMFIIQIIITIIVDFIINIYLLKLITGFDTKKYYKRMIIPITKVTLCSIFFPLLLFFTINESTIRLLVVVFSSIVSVILSVYFLGLDINLRNNISNIIKQKINGI